MSLTKAELVNRLDQRGFGLSKREIRTLVDSTFDTMTDCFIRGEKVKLSNFGNFTVQNKGARRGRNPHTEEEIIISRRRVLTFKASNGLQADVKTTSGDNDE